MRLSAAQFFSSRSSGLVGGDSEQLVLDCYWLARWYHQSPEHFLAMPLSDVHLHIFRTNQLTRLMRTDSDGD